MNSQSSQNKSNKTTKYKAKQKDVKQNNQTCDDVYKQEDQQAFPDSSGSPVSPGSPASSDYSDCLGYNDWISHTSNSEFSLSSNLASNLIPKLLSESQLQLIETYLNQIIEVNKVINLTKISSADKARILHLEDSLAGLPELLKAPDGLYTDLGSGGGFPGVPLAIASGRTTYLVDSVQKKLNAVSQILHTLNLSEKIICKAIRIEDLALLMPKSFSVLSARALSSLPSLLELAAPLLFIGGDLICYKAHVDDEELHHSKELKQLLGMELYSDRSFYLSDNETFRRILVFKKVKEPEIKLPRRVGVAQKRPF